MHSGFSLLQREVILNHLILITIRKTIAWHRNWISGTFPWRNILKLQNCIKISPSHIHPYSQVLFRENPLRWSPHVSFQGSSIHILAYMQCMHIYYNYFTIIFTISKDYIYCSTPIFKDLSTFRYLTFCLHTFPLCRYTGIYLTKPTLVFFKINSWLIFNVVRLFFFSCNNISPTMKY